jgi:hypothetical protein
MPVMYSRRVYAGLSMSRYIEAGLSDMVLRETKPTA